MVRGFNLFGEPKAAAGSTTVHFDYGYVYSHNARLEISGLNFRPFAVAIRVDSAETLKAGDVKMDGTIYRDVLDNNLNTQGYEDGGDFWMRYSLTSLTVSDGGFVATITRRVSSNWEMTEKDAVVDWVAIGI